ncbi:hypothetical protein Pcinc_013480 [Petrolisthes cinctipes]|uniref:Uncharacterized protein n=1 Tax=Petrolisthes cinctipes TaxID=88211 RepID=A0AAE1FYU0_PETCI|nr:hypothetical protein Pcinc_013480 [Petrolisthes cinctipes]
MFITDLQRSETAGTSGICCYSSPPVTSVTPTAASPTHTHSASLLANDTSSFMTGTSNRHVRHPCPTQSASSKRGAKKRVCDETDNVLQEALHQLRELSSSTEVSNTNMAFATVVANDLSQMSDDNKIYAQKLISDILFMGKLGMLSSSTKIT